ncbi:MAG TPA: tetratricopeptide repeat protein [Pyrinomonadaceae bacterium]|nr:tetratricopeptide repeat protein [Pyrinomonadaceae bacterium]
MAFEKAKVLKAAEKFLAQGKIDAAIKEYRAIVEHDEDDFTTLNMLGDLCVRAHKTDEAISCFRRIAEHYREQEFTLKAIAMYKKIERLKPRDPEIAKNLGALYTAHGLVVDARAQYLIVADAYNRAGETQRGLEVLRKIADLDPQNTEIRLKLAAGYLQEGLHPQACAAYREAGARLFEIGEFEKSLESYSKAQELRAYDGEALKGILSAHVALGTADEAAELLEKVVAERPEDSELVAMLARAYIEAEDPQGAERATSILMAQDASNYTRFIEVARLYLKIGETNEAARILASVIEQMLAGREENDLLELVNEVLARDPEHVETLRLLVRIHWWQRDMDKLRVALERLADAAQNADLPDQERYALTQLVRLAPDEQRYIDRLNELGGLQEELIEEVPVTLEPEAAEVPSFESFAAAGAEGHAGLEFETNEAVEDAVSEFEWNSVAEATISDPNASFADLNEDYTDPSDVVVSEIPEFTFNSAEVEGNEVTAAEVVEPQDEARRESLMRQELESVDFYISQGYLDIATDTLDLLEREFGRHAEIEARRQTLNSAEGATPAVAISVEALPSAAVEVSEGNAELNIAITTIEEPPTEQHRITINSNGMATGAGPGIDSGLAQIFEEFKEAAESDAADKDDFETHYNRGTAYKEMDMLDEAIQEFQAAATLASPGEGTPRYLQCCNMLGHCFAQKQMFRAAELWFKKGIESPGHSEDEYMALRYELASAYEQMGDYRRALDTFMEVYGMNISYRDVGERLAELQQHADDSEADKRQRRRK